MSNLFLQHVLCSGKDNPTNDLISIVIFVVFGLAVFLKNIIAAKRQQKQQQKRPITQRPSQKVQVGSEKAKIQKERVEQFLDSILQPKKSSQIKPSVPAAQKPQQPKIIPQSAAEVPLRVSLKKQSIPEFDLNISNILLPPVSETTDSFRKSDLSSFEKNLMSLPGMQVEPENKNVDRLNNQHVSEKISEKKVPETVPFFAGTNDLRNAILYSEILGKPISMREPS